MNPATHEGALQMKMVSLIQLRAGRVRLPMDCTHSPDCTEIKCVIDHYWCHSPEFVVTENKEADGIDNHRS